MTVRSVLLLAALASISPSQTVDPEKLNTVERMCGKVEQVDRSPFAGATSTYGEWRKPIKNAVVRLYHREKDLPCCETAALVEATITNKGGNFSFKNSVPGKYWIVILVEGKEYSHALKYFRESKNKVEVSCADLLYDLRNGELPLGQMVHLD